MLSLSFSRFLSLFLDSPSQFHKYLSLFSRFGPLAGRSRVARGCSLGGFPFFLGNNAHSGKALWSRENHTFEGGSTVFIFFHFLSFSVIFFHVLSCSFIFLRSCSFMFFHFLSFLSFSYVHFRSFSHEFLLNLSCKKINFQGRLGGKKTAPLALFFFSSIFSLFFIFVFFFNFFPCFSFFCFVFHFFIFYSFIFLLFSFLRHSRIPWRKVHILSWLYLLCIGSSSVFTVE